MTRLPFVLILYIGQKFLLAVGLMLAIVGGLASLVDVVELFRRAGNKPDVSTANVVEMAVMKLPHLLSELLPMIVLFGALLAFWNLARRHELVVARAAGISAWQILALPIALAFGFGLLVVTVINPIGSVMQSRFEILENQHLARKNTRIEISATGIWLREVDPSQVLVVNASGMNEAAASLTNVRIFILNTGGGLIERIDAPLVKIDDRGWLIPKGKVSRPSEASIETIDYRLQTDLTLQSIEQQFQSSKSMSFWELQSFAEKMQNAGLNATAYQLRWHSLLSTPIVYGAMVLIAALFTLRTGRMVRGITVVSLAVICGLALYFFTGLVHALGTNATLPPLLAGWLPAMVSLLLASALMLHFEDG